MAYDPRLRRSSLYGYRKGITLNNPYQNDNNYLAHTVGRRGRPKGSRNGFTTLSWYKPVGKIADYIIRNGKKIYTSTLKAGNALQGTLNNVQSKLNNAQAKMNNYKNAYNNANSSGARPTGAYVGTKAFDVNKMTKAFHDSARKAIPSPKKRNPIERAGAFVGSLLGKAKGWGRERLKDIRGGYNRASKFVSGLIGNARTGIGSAGRAIGSAAKTAYDWAGGRLKDAGSAIGKAAGAAKDWAGDRIEDADRFITGSTSKQRNAYNQRAAEGRPTGAMIREDNILEKADKAFEKAKTWAGNRVGDAKNTFEKAKTWAGNRVGDAKNSFEKAKTWAGNRVGDAKNTFEKAKTWAGNRLTDAGRFVDETAEKVTGNKAREELEGAKRSYAIVYNQLNKARAAGNVKAVARLNKVLSNAQEDLAKKQQAYNKSFAGSASNTAATAGRIGKSMLKTGKYLAKGAYDDVSEWAGTTGRKIGSAAATAGKAVGTAAKGAYNKTKNFVEEVPARAKMIWENDIKNNSGMNMPAQMPSDKFYSEHGVYDKPKPKKKKK